MKKSSVKGLFDITDFGFGSYGISGKGNVTTKDDAFAALNEYIEAGGNFIDTAEAYAHSEVFIGEFLKDKKMTNDVILATKTMAGETPETLGRIEEAVNQSLINLKRDYIDIYYLHMPPADVDTMNQALDILEGLKKKGKIRTIGASIKGPNVNDNIIKMHKQYIDTGKTDIILLLYSIFRQKNEEIFDYAKKHDVTLVARTALESGFLSGALKKDTTFTKTDHRNRWSDKQASIIDDVEELTNIMVENKWDTSILSLALRFTISPDAIASTVAGARNKVQVEGLLDALNKGKLNQDIINKLRARYYNSYEKYNI